MRKTRRKPRAKNPDITKVLAVIARHARSTDEEWTFLTMLGLE